MDDIEKVFNGKFKEQRNSESAWTPVPDEMVPKPRWEDHTKDFRINKSTDTSIQTIDILVFLLCLDPVSVVAEQFVWTNGPRRELQQL